jgi:hypothetical protein
VEVSAVGEAFGVGTVLGEVGVQEASAELGTHAHEVRR